MDEELVMPQDSLETVPLKSENNVDYSHLRDLLKAQKWPEADLETFKVIKKAANREQDERLDLDSLRKLPCKDLRTIDRLWVVASGGKFGFSVQKKIWEECGSPTKRSEEWDRFCVKVGWKKGPSSTRHFHTYELKANPQISPAGELPVGWMKYSLLCRLNGIEHLQRWVSLCSCKDLSECSSSEF